jgi:hypothetical protein
MLDVPNAFSTVEARDRAIARRIECLGSLLHHTEVTAQLAQAEHNQHDDVERPLSIWPKSSTETGFMYRVDLFCPLRRFFITKTGYWGLGPGVMCAGDKCWILYGARVPYILRPWGGQGRYKLAGECYVYGLMEGQAMDMLNCGEIIEEWFTIC